MITTEYFGLYIQGTPPAPTLLGTELVPVIIAGVTMQTTTQDIANLAPGKTKLVYSNTWLNKGSDLALLPIWTPAADGVFRINLIACTPTVNGAAGTETFFVNTTDPSGINANNSLLSVGLNANAGPFANSPYLLYCQAGQPISILATNAGGYGPGATWSLAVQLEQMM
jgi:hypothetical protein